MAYAKDGYPVEAASKIGHLKIVGNQTIRRVIESFEAFEPTGPSLIAQNVHRVDLTIPCGLRHVVTIDGGQTLVPNQLRREKTVAFIQVAACLLKFADLERMRRDPMMDPREVGQISATKRGRTRLYSRYLGFAWQVKQCARRYGKRSTIRS